MSEANSLGCGLDLERLHSRVTDGLGNAVGEGLVDGSINRDCKKFVSKVGLEMSITRGIRCLALTSADLTLPR
jgi:hypothetical protein